MAQIAVCGACEREFPPTQHQTVRMQRAQPVYCGRECIKAIHASRAHIRNPDQPCTTCGKSFALTRSQKHKLKARPNTGLYCSTTCLYASRKTNPKKIWTKKRGEGYFTTAACYGCGDTFTPTERQRTWAFKNPCARTFCSSDCEYGWRKEFMRLLPMLHSYAPPRGQDNPHWKHGLYSTVAREVYRLRRDIKKFINEGESK